MIQWKDILNNAKMIRNYRTSYRPRKDKRITRLWLEKPVLKTANLTPGTGIIVSIKEAALKQSEDKVVAVPVVHIRAAMNVEVPTNSIAQKNGNPILDIANTEIDSALGVNIKLDIVVKSNQEIYVYRELSFEMVSFGDKPKYCSDHLQKYRVISLFCGSGGMTAGLINTQACESVFALDVDVLEQNPYSYSLEDKEPNYNAWAVEAFRDNFPDTLFYWGEIQSVHDIYIPKADIVCISPPCTEFSLLGGRMEGLIEHFVFHIARIVIKSEARALFIENVENYFRSETFQQLKRLLAPHFTYWYQENIDSYDYGSLDSRKRGYAVALKEESGFRFPKPVKTPLSRRKKVKDYLLSKEDRKWLPIEGTAMENIVGEHRIKYNHTNFTSDHNATLVSYNDIRISCITKGYNSIKPTQSYLLHPDGDKWSKFTPEEIKNILHYPQWFHFPSEIPTTRYYELLGNSVNIRAIEAIASQLVCALMECDIKRQVQQQSNSREQEDRFAFEQSASGQLGFVI